jgi:hypothetical protein
MTTTIRFTSVDGVEWISQKLVDTLHDFHAFRNSYYKCVARPALFWPDGRNIGFGSGSGPYFYSKFKYWGFSGPAAFFSLPSDLRNKYYQTGCESWLHIFGEPGNWRQDILTEDGQIRIQEHLISTFDRKTLGAKERAFSTTLERLAIGIQEECFLIPGCADYVRKERARIRAEVHWHLECNSINRLG